ncbi:cell division control protein 2 [Canna indica]|uniref:Cell division control protein 2 n=1 Tax=Canna indica TaxID=4628 RepID=A0AAQ3Q7I9_9LILI|nr:cell division control protein 2 [Canna indica]
MTPDESTCDPHSHSTQTRPPDLPECRASLLLFFSSNEPLHRIQAPLHQISVSGELLQATATRNYLYQLCKGVAHCHSHVVLHRDLKPQNLLVDKAKGILKIVDLGLGRAFSVPLKSYTDKILTLWYRAPEILLGETHYSTGVDIWSVGCIFAEMARGQIFYLLGTPTEEQWPGVTSLRNWHEYPQWKAQNLTLVVPNLEPEGVDPLAKMLEYDPTKRMSAKEAIAHRYFNSQLKKITNESKLDS